MKSLCMTYDQSCLVHLHELNLVYDPTSLLTRCVHKDTIMQTSSCYKNVWRIKLENWNAQKEGLTYRPTAGNKSAKSSFLGEAVKKKKTKK